MCYVIILACIDSVCSLSQVLSAAEPEIVSFVYDRKMEFAAEALLARLL